MNGRDHTEVNSLAWSSLPRALSGPLSTLSNALGRDPQWLAFISSRALSVPVTMGLQASGGEAVLISLAPGSPGPNSHPEASVSSGPASAADFTLTAKPEHWAAFFWPDPKAPFTSFVGMQGMNVKQDGAGVLGDQTRYAQHAHLMTRLLEVLREMLHGSRSVEDLSIADEKVEEDHITGRYVWVDCPVWGRAKIFYESSGTGPQQVLFLHTAGSDSRQYHGIMNLEVLRARCTMYAFDLPAHGRSFPPRGYVPGSWTNTEDAYVGTIGAVIRALKLQKPIVCGASMAGQVCVAVAIRAEEVGAGGVIPLQACDYLSMERVWHDKSPLVNQSLWNPDWVYGMMAPKSPLENKRLIWHMYSGQAYGIFHGDLDFYFGGFDARNRLELIDTKKCPVHFLTGEYDWSTTPDMTKATARKIKGARYSTMKGLGHFPATENPDIFVLYFTQALEWIEIMRET